MNSRTAESIPPICGARRSEVKKGAAAGNHGGRRRIESHMRSLSETRAMALAEADLRHQYRLMLRWCRWFGKTDLEWVTAAAKRYRDRHPCARRCAWRREAV